MRKYTSLFLVCSLLFINSCNLESFLDEVESKDISNNNSKDNTNNDDVENPQIENEKEMINELYNNDKINFEFTKHEIFDRFLDYSDNHIVNDDSDPRTQRMVTTISQINNMVKDDNLNDSYYRLDVF